jgi:hypothetical protein
MKVTPHAGEWRVRGGGRVVVVRGATAAPLLMGGWSGRALDTSPSYESFVV